MDSCDCAQYPHLEMLRESISLRIKETKALKKRLKRIAKTEDGEHILYQCSSCNQFWQGSRAWNWGNDLYIFKVPKIEKEEWLSLIYVQPDELLIFTACMHNFLENSNFKPKGEKCQKDKCEREAVESSINCLEHHVANMQRMGNLPKNPEGRWFDPYEQQKILPAL